MNVFTPTSIPGPTGTLEALILENTAPLRGIALVAHPNPLEGGTFTNKIVHTLAKSLSQQGYIACCPNLRGVGNSEGSHDYGNGEVDDMQAVLHYMQQQYGDLPVVLSGFSFGTFVQSQLYQRLKDTLKLDGMILVGPATSRHTFPDVPAETLVIHGEADEVVPLQTTLDWARPQLLPVIVVPDTGHFFHGRLLILSQLIALRWRPKSC